MDSLWKSCQVYFETDEAKKQLKNTVLSPLGGIVYEEFYIYVWIICFYHVFLILLVFTIFILIVRQNRPVFIPVQVV
jgi:hypothetical protein